MLTFAEEILLLALDDNSGALKELPTLSLPYALSGAVLMDLALANRIDTDLKTLSLVDSTPTGDAALDLVLSKIAAEKEPKKIEYWLEVAANESHHIKEHALQQLMAKNVLKREEHRILWVFATRRYKSLDDQEQKEVKSRLRELVLGSDLPDARDIVLLSLLRSCNLLGEFLSEEEIEGHRDRIENLSKMDLIGQAVARSITEIQNSIMTSMLYPS